MNNTRLYYLLAVTSYGVLLLTLCSWFVNSYSAIRSPWVIASVLAVLLLLPVRGMLKGKPYTFAWSSMLAFVYFTHGIIELYSNAAAFTFALSEVISSAIFITFAGIYTRLRSRELKQPASQNDSP